MKRNALKVLTAVFILALAVTCSVNVQAAKLKLNRKKIVLSINESFKLRAMGSKKVKWSSSAPRIAKVNKNGKVTGKRAGKAVIAVKAGKKTLKCKVTVENPRISRTNLKLNKGDSYKLKIKGTRRKVKWSVKNSKIAGITKKGVVKARKAGKTRIYGKVGKKKYSCRLTVADTKPVADKTMKMDEGEQEERRATPAETKIETENPPSSETAQTIETVPEEESTAGQKVITSKTVTEPAGSNYKYSITNYNTDSVFNYELQILNNPKYHLYTYGNGVPAEVLFLLKTNNPNEETIIQSTGVLDDALGCCNSYDDIRYTESLDERWYTANGTRVVGGWLNVVSYRTTGTKTLKVYENIEGRKKLVAEASVIIEDGELSRNSWIDSVIKQVTSSDMTDTEKAIAIEQYIKKDFIYLRSDSVSTKAARWFTFDVGPVWERKIIDCSVSPTLLEWFMIKLQIPYEIQPAASHGDVTITCDGKTTWLNATPPSRTGVINFAWDYVN